MSTSEESARRGLKYFKVLAMMEVKYVAISARQISHRGCYHFSAQPPVNQLPRPPLLARPIEVSDGER